MLTLRYNASMSEARPAKIEYIVEPEYRGILLPQPEIHDIVAPVAVYNPSSILTVNIDGEDAALFWARVEPDTPESYLGHSEVRLFSIDSANIPQEVVGAPRLAGEDPSFILIDDQLLVGVVELDDNHQPTTVFYNYDPLLQICDERLRGPRGQKDVRIAPIDPRDASRGLVVYGRPDFGNDVRRITRTYISGFDDPGIDTKMQYLTQPEAVIGAELFVPIVDSDGMHPSWGGINTVSHIEAADGTLYPLLGAHKAHFTSHSTEGHRSRHYEGMLLVDVGDTLLHVGTFGTREDFPPAPPKAGRDDLNDVAFFGGFENASLEGRTLFGLGDSRLGMIEMSSAEVAEIKEYIQFCIDEYFANDLVAVA